jgi:hypothetical protein
VEPRAGHARQLRPPRIWRAVLLAIILAPVQTYWLIMLEVVRCSGFSSTVSIFFNVVLTVVALVALNLALRRFLPSQALTRAELLTVYAMLSLVTCLCSIDIMDPMICLMPFATRYATPENHWQQQFFQYLPRQWTVTDPAVVTAYYTGGTTLYRADILLAWARPAALWVLFLTALTTVMLCLNVLIRRRWMDEERLTYPIAVLPYELTDPAAGLLRRPLLWVGFALAGLYDTLNGLHSLWPVVPAINLQLFRLDPYLQSPPWSGIGWTPLTLFPFMVGLGYLLPMELLVSFWVFFLVWKAEKVVVASLGLPMGLHQWPFLDEQAFGCYAAIVAFALYAMRGHLAHVVRAVREGARAEPGDPFSYRTAAVGAAVGLAIVITVVIQGGLPVWAGLAFFALYYLIALCVTRMRAQFGPPIHDLHFVGPDQMLTSVLGTMAFDTRALVAMTYLYGFNRAYRSHPMPHQLETLRMCQRAGIESRGIALAMVAAIFVGAIAYFWTYLHIAYNLGADHKMTGWASTGYAVEAFARLGGWLANPTGPRLQVIGAVAVGLATTLGLMLLQSRFVWLPLHPLGYAISNGWSAHWTYSSLFVAWALKTIITRYWGHKAYQRAMPLFLGLVLGEFVVGGMWTMAATFTGAPIFYFWKG